MTVMDHRRAPGRRPATPNELRKLVALQTRHQAAVSAVDATHDTMVDYLVELILSGVTRKSLLAAAYPTPDDEPNTTQHTFKRRINESLARRGLQPDWSLAAADD